VVAFVNVILIWLDAVASELVKRPRYERNALLVFTDVMVAVSEEAALANEIVPYCILFRFENSTTQNPAVVVYPPAMYRVAVTVVELVRVILTNDSLS
jgi:hypothetical protein